MSEQTSFPLSWPENWPRTVGHQRRDSPFKRPVAFAARGHSMDECRRALARDKWRRVEDNIWAIIKHIESIRGQARWGVGNVEQAFRGYMALPAPGQTSGANWWQTLGVAINATPGQVREAYLQLVKKHHPDRQGDPELFRRVQEAWQQFERIEQKPAA